ncbi:hypothetical protein HDF16_002948 [Granulicella aggregans]|uniref:Uncharacterized protein n=1 Tax=Granulicella aggregans TaxID=474949 RepID=A0A7W8E4E6_9BACT|nr:hypothetical protein [Granulicella aggregans]MBB5058234.1 hypothetical protein [Granulicella aggregans]
MKLSLPAILLATTLAVSAQSTVKPFPKPALAAKTVAIVNNTHQEGVTEGATDAIKRWGHLTLIDDADAADITLVFDKKSEHEKSTTQKTGEDGKPESTFSMSFSSAIHMHASLKGAPTAFYSTTSSDSKKKAGEACILDLQHAYLDNH